MNEYTTKFEKKEESIPLIVNDEINVFEEGEIVNSPESKIILKIF